MRNSPSVKKNIVANYLGQGWVAIMSLAFIPLYIHYIGIEAYGLIGFFAMIQAWMTLLDMGMSPTLTREMAKFSTGRVQLQNIKNLLRSIELIVMSLAIIVAVLVFMLSDWIANDWLNASELPLTTVSHVIILIGSIVGLRFLESIYRSALFGLQEQVLYNVLNILLSTLRQGGCVIVLIWLSPTIQAFFIWQLLVSILTIVTLAFATKYVLPSTEKPSQFSLPLIVNIWRFAGGMMVITLLSLLLMQVDKIILSRFLSLSSFGYYTFATAVATSLYMLVSPITATIYPRMIQIIENKETEQLSNIYHKGSQLVSIAIIPFSVLFCVYSQEVIYVWSGNHELAKYAGSLLSILAIGTLLNAFMNMPYQLQIAYGWTQLSIKANIFAVITLSPTLFFIVPHYGATGAAWLWVLLNSTYVFIVIHMMHKKLLINDKWHWYIFDIIRPLFAVSIVFLLSLYIQPDFYHHRLLSGMFFFFLLLFSIVAATMASALVFPMVKLMIQQKIHNNIKAKHF